VTVETFCTSGQAERFKGSVHAAAGTIVGAMAVYNAVAWCYRRERHLGWNAIIYGVGFAWEAYQTSRHFRKPTHPMLAVVETPPLAVVETPPLTIAQSCACDQGLCWCDADASAGLEAAS
jgi:hypothetical protein